MKKFTIPEALQKRIQNKVFWVSLISVCIVLIKEVAALFGIELDLNGVAEQLEGIVTSIFAILGILGVFVDPTTPGIKDVTTVTTNNNNTVEEEDTMTKPE